MLRGATEKSDKSENDEGFSVLPKYTPARLRLQKRARSLRAWINPGSLSGVREYPTCPQRSRIVNMDCALCGKYARYVAEDDGIGTMAGVTVKVSKGDPVCLECVATLPMKTNQNRYVRVESVERIEPGKVSIGGRTPK